MGGWGVWTKAARSAACAHLPHCIPCAGEANAIACAAADLAVPPIICDACNGNPICKTLDATAEVYNELNALLLEIGAQVVGPLVEAAKKNLLDLYAGPYANEFLLQYRAQQEERVELHPAFIVNAAFLKEDLAFDAERSVATWESRPVQWNSSTGHIGPERACRAGLTDFVLASTPELIADVYSRAFRGPEDCFIPLSDTSAAILVTMTNLL